MKILAITACTAGVAHTYMAAKNLENKAKARGIEIKVEKQGANGIDGRISKQDVEEASGIIFATDVGVAEMERFEGLVSVQGKVKDGIKKADAMIDALEQKIAEAGSNKKVPASSTSENEFMEKNEEKGGVMGFLKLWYAGALSGVSHIIPIIVFGGLTIGLLNLIFGYDATHNPENVTIHFMYYAGLATLQLMVPVIAAYTAYGMVGKPGLAPGFAGGLIAKGGAFGKLAIVGSGFMGALVAGAIAAAAIMVLRKIKVPAALESVKMLILVPLFSGLITCGAMIMGPGQFFAYLNTGLTEGLTSMSGSNLLLLGAILGLMSNFDLGGPVNKVAYLFCIGMWTEGHWEFYCAFTAAKCVPGVTLGLMAKFFPKFFDEEDRAASVSTFILGFCGITEGAIPYALKDPIRIIPAQMIGGAVACGLVLSAGIKISTGAGGAVFMLPLIDQPGLWITYFAMGCAATVVTTLALKKVHHVKLQKQAKLQKAAA